MSLPLIAPLAVLIVVILVAYNGRRLAWARHAMQRAVADRGLDLLSARLCWLPRGPFGTAIALHHPVYRIRVRARGSAPRLGWVHCLPLSDHTEIVLE